MTRRLLCLMAGILVVAGGFYVGWLLRDADWFYRDTVSSVITCAGAAMIGFSLFDPKLWKREG